MKASIFAWAMNFGSELAKEVQPESSTAIWQISAIIQPVKVARSTKNSFKMSSASPKNTVKEKSYQSCCTNSIFGR